MPSVRGLLDLALLLVDMAAIKRGGIANLIHLFSGFIQKQRDSFRADPINRHCRGWIKGKTTVRRLYAVTDSHQRFAHTVITGQGIRIVHCPFTVRERRTVIVGSPGGHVVREGIVSRVQGAVR